MAELKLPRLLAAAKEFNVGQETLVDFLLAKGFPKDDLKPSSKLTEVMYRSLQQEFQGDKVAKMKSDQVDLPKGTQAETKKKKEEEEISFKKDEKKIIKKAKVEEVVAEVIVEKEEKVTNGKPKKEKQEKDKEVIKTEAPEIEGLKVIDRIDLSTIDSSTRPKKGVKKATSSKEEQAEEKEKEDKKKKEAKTGTSKKKKAESEEAEIKELIQEKAPEKEAEAPPLIENIKAGRLEGPKILGKIELPVDNDTRPKTDEKRKRKRIPIEKKTTGKTELFKDRDKKPGTFNRDDRSRDRRGGGRREIRKEDKLIDEKEIQEKIRETQAKLIGTGGRGATRHPGCGHSGAPASRLAS